MKNDYSIYYYDSWCESFNKFTTCETLQKARETANKEFMCTTDSDITEIIIYWFDCGVEREEQYILNEVENGKKWEKV